MQLEKENVTFSCVYTHQKTKKKKSWCDGQVRVYSSQKRIVLHKWDENSSSVTDVMDCKYCSGLEIDRILNGQADSVEFEKFLVEIDRFAEVSMPVVSSTINTAPMITRHIPAPSLKSTTARPVPKVVPKLKLTKFQVPKTVIPVQPTTASSLSESNGQHGASRTSLTAATATATVQGIYSIHDDELDDIWSSVPPPSSTAHISLDSPTRHQLVQDSEKGELLNGHHTFMSHRDGPSRVDNEISHNSSVYTDQDYIQQQRLQSQRKPDTSLHQKFHHQSSNPTQSCWTTIPESVSIVAGTVDEDHSRSGCYQPNPPSALQGSTIPVGADENMDSELIPHTFTHATENPSDSRRTDPTGKSHLLPGGDDDDGVAESVSWRDGGESELLPTHKRQKTNRHIHQVSATCPGGTSSHHIFSGTGHDCVDNCPPSSLSSSQDVFGCELEVPGVGRSDVDALFKPPRGGVSVSKGVCNSGNEDLRTLFSFAVDDRKTDTFPGPGTDGDETAPMKAKNCPTLTQVDKSFDKPEFDEIEDITRRNPSTSGGRRRSRGGVGMDDRPLHREDDTGRITKDSVNTRNTHNGSDDDDDCNRYNDDDDGVCAPPSLLPHHVNSRSDTIKSSLSLSRALTASTAHAGDHTTTTSASGDPPWTAPEHAMRSYGGTMISDHVRADGCNVSALPSSSHWSSSCGRGNGINDVKELDKKYTAAAKLVRDRSPSTSIIFPVSMNSSSSSSNHHSSSATHPHAYNGTADLNKGSAPHGNDSKESCGAGGGTLFTWSGLGASATSCSLSDSLLVDSTADCSWDFE